MASSASRVAVLGGGLAGLAFGARYRGDCVILEAEQEAGGLVRSCAIDVEGVGRYWFDRVLHLLYFSDEEVEMTVRALLGGALQRCPPHAWVETPFGTAPYPVQLNLSAFPPEIVAKCLADLARTQDDPDPAPPADMREALLRTYGEGLCDLFLLPYNRKLWGRPLETMAGRLGWTMTAPDLDAVRRGAVVGHEADRPYNHNGWYPRPDADAPLRAMGVLSAALAARAADLRLGHRVTALDLDSRRVEVAAPSGSLTLDYDEVVATLPLPILADLSVGLPDADRRAAGRLRQNRVWSVAICLTGPRPQGRGLWRYYSDETLVFTRLVYMHEFDPLAAPDGGWGLLAEVVEPAECPGRDPDELAGRVVADALRAGAIDAGSKVRRVGVWCSDPAYVAFTAETEEIVGALAARLAAAGVHLLGRYGRWSYLSMAQVIREAMDLADRLDGGREGARPRNRA